MKISQLNFRTEQRPNLIETERQKSNLYVA